MAEEQLYQQILNAVQEIKAQTGQIQKTLTDLRLDVTRMGVTTENVAVQCKKNAADIKSLETTVTQHGHTLSAISTTNQYQQKGLENQQKGLDWARDKIWALLAIATGATTVGALIGKFLL